MKKNKYYCALFRCIAMISVLFCSCIIFGSHVYADEKPEYRLTIHPSQNRFEELKPGTVYTGTFNVRNDGQNEFDFKITFAPYSVESESYSPSYDKETVYTEMSKWISVDHDFGTLQANQEAEIKYSINVPSDAHGGAQAATILVTMDNHSKVEEGSGVKTVRQLGYVVIGNVDGDVIKTGKILENKLPQFLFNPPIYGSALVENTGNVYTVAMHTLQVFPLFSDEEIFTNEENPETSIVFPETKRLFNSEWEGAPQLGIFRVRHTVKIFDEESVVEKVVFLCPIWFLFVVILMIILIIFWIVSRIIGRKREV